MMKKKKRQEKTNRKKKENEKKKKKKKKNNTVEFFLRVASGPRVKLANCKSALNPRWFALLTVLRQWSRC